MNVVKESALVDERELLLEKVNFKWLMAGFGWWVDMSLFHQDASYAERWLKLAGESESVELRKCAGVLKFQNHHCPGGDLMARGQDH